MSIVLAATPVLPFPSEEELRAGVRRLHTMSDKLNRRNNLAGVIATPGAGAILEYWLRREGGSSRTLLGSHSLYHSATQETYLGYDPGSSVDEGVTIDLAARTYEEANRIADRKQLGCRLFGLVLDGAIYTDRKRKGADQCFIALKTDTGTFIMNVQFPKPFGEYSKVGRDEQDNWCALLALNLLLDTAGAPIVELPILTDHKDLITITWPRRVSPEVTSMDDLGAKTYFGPHGTRGTSGVITPGTHALIPSSIDVLSPAHDAMALWAKRELALEPVFNLELLHPVKGEVPLSDANARISAMIGLHAVVVTRGHGKYIEKAMHFPGVPMLMGADAFRTMLEHAAKEDGVDGIFRELNVFREHGTLIYVFSRVIHGHVLTLMDVLRPFALTSEPLTTVAIEVNSLTQLPGVDWSISSTELRRRRSERAADES